jgi:hypothetical protein
MDRDEVDKATEMLKRYDRSGRQAVSLSAHLNSTFDFSKDREQFEMLKINGEYHKMYKAFVCPVASCNIRFVMQYQLQEHLEDHETKKRAE